jgi:hypothetical protein
MITPSVSFDFTTASLDPRVTFTRSGATATVVNSSGVIQGVAADTPRFNYNPSTLACTGLLIEEAQTNLSLYSEQLNQVSWTLAGATVSANAINSPDGTLNADKLQEDSTTGAHRINQAYVKAASAITYTMSMYVKPAERSQLQIRLRATSIGNNGTAIFNVSTGVVNSVTASGTYSNASATISLQNNGWYRCTLTVTTDTGVAVSLNANLYNGSDSYTGVTGNGLYIWGAQLEAAAFATSYIPTTLLPLTRNADVATITGTNFSDFWQAVKGGASVLSTPSTVSGIRPLVQFDDNTANEIIALRGNTTNPELYIVDGGTPQAQLDAGTIAANTAYSLTGWWATDDCKARKDSGAVVTDTTAIIPTVTQARIGSDGTNYLNGTIATINYYDSFFGRPIYTRRKNKVFSSLL